MTSIRTKSQQVPRKSKYNNNAGERSVKRPRSAWEDNVKIDIKEIGVNFKLN